MYIFTEYESMSAWGQVIDISLSFDSIYFIEKIDKSSIAIKWWKS